MGDGKIDSLRLTATGPPIKEARRALADVRRRKSDLRLRAQDRSQSRDDRRSDWPRFPRLLLLRNFPPSH